MISLELNKPTEEQLMTSLSEAVTARNLLENKDFQWLVERLEEKITKNYKKLAHDEESKQFHKRQGTIFAIELLLKELRFKASTVEELEERLKEYDRPDEPVARGA
jgi:hypothetical protein